MSKAKAGFYWCASCGGCEEAVVDLAEDILEVVQQIDILFWPVALDFKRSDVEQLADKELDVCFINGAIRSSEQAEMVELLREKSKLVVAFGSCAQLGGIPGLANFYDRQGIVDRAYHLAPSVDNESKLEPQVVSMVAARSLTLPSLWETVKTLDQVIEVDYYLPGCPPPVRLIKEAVGAIVAGELPERGATLAPDMALCEECNRRDSKPEKLAIAAFKRPHQILIDPQQCLLAQGLLCLGPITRKGCGAACVEGNMPCTGCMGPLSRVRDFGAKALAATASILEATEEGDIEKALSEVVDPGGTFYRYSLPGSLLHRSLNGSTDRGVQS